MCLECRVPIDTQSPAILASAVRHERDGYMLNRDEGPPLYAQLEHALRERIARGDWSAGDLLPTEPMLGQDYGVSRITVRRALDALAQRGLIVRRHGIGTFVAERDPGVRTVRLTGSLDDYLVGEERYEMRVLSFGEMAPTARVREVLGLRPDEPTVRLEVVSELYGNPALYVELFFTPAIGRRIDPADLLPGTTVIGMLQQKLGVKVLRARQLISAALAGEAAGRNLGLPPDMPLLFIERVHYAAQDQAIEMVLIRHHPERYQYVNELVAGASA